MSARIPKPTPKSWPHDFTIKVTVKGETTHHLNPPEWWISRETIPKRSFREPPPIQTFLVRAPDPKWVRARAAHPTSNSCQTPESGLRGSRRANRAPRRRDACGAKKKGGRRPRKRTEGHDAKFAGTAKTRKSTRFKMCLCIFWDIGSTIVSWLPQLPTLGVCFFEGALSMLG